MHFLCFFLDFFVMQTTVVFFCGFDLSTIGATDRMLLVAAEEVGWKSTVTFTGMTSNWQYLMSMIVRMYANTELRRVWDMIQLCHMTVKFV